MDGEEHGGDRRPIPDPTLLTTQQLMSAVSALKELVFAQIEALKVSIVTRLDGNDKAVALLSDNVNRVPTNIDNQIAHLKELHNQKFASIEEQSKQNAVQSKDALGAALSSAEKASDKQWEAFALSINKAETATTKQMDQLNILVQTMTSSLENKIEASKATLAQQLGDLKDRVTAIEGKSTGVQTAQTSQQTSSRDSWSIVAAVISVIAVIAAVVTALVLKLAG